MTPRHRARGPFDRIEITVACDGVEVQEMVDLELGETPMQAAHRFLLKGGFPLASKVEWTAHRKVQQQERLDQ